MCGAWEGREGQALVVVGAYRGARGDGRKCGLGPARAGLGCCSGRPRGLYREVDAPHLCTTIAQAGEPEPEPG